MIVISFKTKKDKENMLRKVKEIEACTKELMECLEEAQHKDYDEYEEDDYYPERYSRERIPRGRYEYMRR